MIWFIDIVEGLFIAVGGYVLIWGLFKIFGK